MKQKISNAIEGSVVGVVEGPSAKIRRAFRGSPGSKRPLILLVVIVVVVAIGVVGVLRSGDNKKAAESQVLQVSGNNVTHGLTQKEYDAVIEQAKQTTVSEESAKETIIKAYQYKIIASTLNIAPSDEQVARAARTVNYSGEGALNDWQKLYGYAAGAEGNLKLAKNGGYLGAYFNYPADLPYASSKPDTKAIEESKKYAGDQAASDRQQLADGKITVDTLLDKLSKDPKLVPAASSNPSKLLRVDTFGTTYVDGALSTITEPDFVMQAIDQLGKKSGVSTVQEVIDTAPGSTKRIVTSYFFLTVTNVFPANPNIDTDVANAIKTLKVVDNVQ